MNEQSIFQLIGEITHQQNVLCVLIGGFIINHYKMSRQTAGIVNLIRNNGVNVKNKNFKVLCLKFGTENIYQKVLEAVI